MLCPPPFLTLPTRSKQGKKSSKSIAIRWHDFVRAQGFCSFDPLRHNLELLKSFLESLNGSSIVGRAPLSVAHVAVQGQNPPGKLGSASIAVAPPASLLQSDVASEGHNLPSMVGSASMAVAPHASLLQNDEQTYKPQNSVQQVALAPTAATSLQCAAPAQFDQNIVDDADAALAVITPQAVNLPVTSPELSDLEYLTEKTQHATLNVSADEMKPLPLRSPTLHISGCTFLGAGHCAFGKKCKYSHLMIADAESLRAELQRHLDMGIKVNRLTKTSDTEPSTENLPSSTFTSEQPSEAGSSTASRALAP